MHKLYYFHIQLTANSTWITEIGHSLTEVMSNLKAYNTEPYAWFKAEF